MIQQIRYRPMGLVACGLLAFALCGCSRADRAELDILPNGDKARDALDRALTAWKNGDKMGNVNTGSYSIQVADKVWMTGKKLAAFEIVGTEDKPGPRWFRVRLTVAGAQPQQVRYAVFGMEPMQVFREEDYEQLCSMGR